MEHILLLPEEIIIFIVKKLDLQSQMNLHRTCSYLKNIVTLCGVIKVCDVPPGPLASPSILKVDFFNSVAGHLEALNLCAVSDLTKSALLPIMKNLKCLKTLDVSYTNIVVPDVVDIKKSCSSLKNISINFLFGKIKAGVRIPQKVLIQCQDVFQHFENVEFVGVKGNLMQSQLPLYVLKKATNLNEVRFTVIQSNHAVYYSEDCDKLFHYNYLQLQLLNWNLINANPIQRDSYSVILPMLDLTTIEYFIIQVEDTVKIPQVWTSKLFENLFEGNCVQPVHHIDRLDTIDLNSNVIYFIWDKHTTMFDDLFFSKLCKQIKCLLPHQVSASSIPESATAPKDIDWLFICLDYKSTPPRTAREESIEPLAKKQRLGLTKYAIDFDVYLKDIKSIKLTLQFLFNPTVCLKSTSSYLKKLTYLNLAGRVNFSGDFFKILFQCCDKLETLNVDSQESRSTATFISNSIYLSSSLKNLRLAEWIQGNGINVLLSSISTCQLIENVHIYNMNVEITELNNLGLLVARCANLHSLYIRTMMSENKKIKVLRLLSNAKVKYGKNYLKIQICCQNLGESYNPYNAVFSLSSIKRI